MRLPPQWKQVTLNPAGYETTYPPFGFYSFSEHELGNGDTFGLYWAIGREGEEPIVAETYHDEWSLQPHFSCLERFLSAAEKAASEEAEEEGEPLESLKGLVHVRGPTIEEDDHSPVACLQSARDRLQQQDVGRAIEYLERAVTVLPEYGEAQALLSAQYRRVDQPEKAVRAGIQALISPPCFGGDPTRVAGWMRRQRACPDDLEADPIWTHREALTGRFGGTKENDQFAIFRSAIDTYLDQGEVVRAMTLMQSYADRMGRETHSFQERHGFVVSEFLAWQREVADLHGRSRLLELL